MTPEEQTRSIMDPRWLDPPRHPETIKYLSDLLTDLHLQIEGYEPLRPVDGARIEEGHRHVRALEQCRLPRIRY